MRARTHPFPSLLKVGQGRSHRPTLVLTRVWLWLFEFPSPQLLPRASQPGVDVPVQARDHRPKHFRPVPEDVVVTIHCRVETLPQTALGTKVRDPALDANAGSGEDCDRPRPRDQPRRRLEGVLRLPMRGGPPAKVTLGHPVAHLSLPLLRPPAPRGVDAMKSEARGWDGVSREGWTRRRVAASGNRLPCRPRRSRALPPQQQGPPSSPPPPLFR